MRTFTLAVAFGIAALVPTQTYAEGWTIGGLAINGPTHAGSADQSLSLFPLIQYETGPWTFGGENLVTYADHPDLGWGYDLALGYDFGQDEAGVPNVGSAATAVGRATYHHSFFEASLGATQRLGSDGGMQFDLSIASGYPISQNVFVAISLGAVYGSADQRNLYYGLNSSGLEETSLSLFGFIQLNETANLLIGATRSNLGNDLRGLSFVDQGSTTSLAIGYSRSL